MKNKRVGKIEQSSENQNRCENVKKIPQPIEFQFFGIGKIFIEPRPIFLIMADGKKEKREIPDKFSNENRRFKIFPVIVVKPIFPLNRMREKVKTDGKINRGRNKKI